MTPLKNMSPFELLGLKPSLSLYKNDLKKIYLHTQKMIHPDKFIQQPKYFLFATEISSLVNKALATLTCPLQRSLAFIKAHNMPTNIESCANDPSVLDELLELQSSVHNAPDPKEALMIISSLQATITKNLRTIEKAVATNNPTLALQTTAHISFLLRIKKDAKKSLPKKYAILD